MSVSPQHAQDARRAVDLAARTSYGRLLALLSSRTKDVAAAEDALADALKRALESWALTGVPDKPDAWLLQVARRRMIDAMRRGRTASASALGVTRWLENTQADDGDFPDHRLRLMFACAHPQIDPAIHTPLMLQTVLGLDAARIASVFLVAPAAMGQRLSRAKSRIREHQLSFELPDADDLPVRLEAVLQAIYVAYTSARDDTSEPNNGSLSSEALFLARVVVSLTPGEPEPMGLLALILFSDSRTAARRSEDGRYIPLGEQNVALWSRAQIEEAEWILHQAAMLRRPGRFQIEAAIQSAHAERLRGARVEWRGIVALYDALLQIAPSIGAKLGRAAAVAECRGPDVAYQALAEILDGGLGDHQPYWALRAHLAAATGRREEASASYQRAAGLAIDPAVRAFLLSRMTELQP